MRGMLRCNTKLPTPSQRKSAYVGSKGTHGFAGNGPNYDVNPVGRIVGFGNPALTPERASAPLPQYPVRLGQLLWQRCCQHLQRVRSRRWRSGSRRACSSCHTTPTRTPTTTHDGYYAISHPIAWGPVDFNRNQVFVFNTVYELPFGKGKAYLGDVEQGHELRWWADGS